MHPGLIPVLAINPRKPMKKKRSGRRRPRRRNPALNKAIGVAVAVVGGALMAGAGYAADGLNVSRGWIGAGQAAVGILVGGAVSLVQPELGLGIVGGGSAVGGYNMLTAGLDATSKAAGAEDKAEETEPVEAIVGTVGRKNVQLRRGTRSSRQLGAAEGALSAVTAMVGGRDVQLRRGMNG